MKNILKGLVTALALAVALVAPNVALADDSTTEDTTTTSSSYITKTWTVESADQAGTESFEYVLTYIENSAEALGTNPTPTTTPTLATDADGEATISLTTSSSSLSATGTTSLWDLVNEYTFSEVGIYYFTLSETTGSNTNISYDTTTYIVKVSVTWTDENYTEFEVSAVAVYAVDSDGNATTKTDADFNNTPATNSDVTLKKVVKGLTADPTDDFTFTVTFTGLTGSYTFEASEGVTVTDSEGNTVTSVTNGTYTVTLSNGEYITFPNLPNGATYVIDETATEDYSESAEASGATVTTGDDNVTASGTVDGTDDTVTWTNISTFTTDTGITLNTLVFGGIALVAVAGVGVLLVTRRRRSYDEF